MSRFFETLKEVSRSQPVPNPGPANESGERAMDGLDQFTMADLPNPTAVGQTGTIQGHPTLAHPIPEQPVHERRESPADFLDALAPRTNGLVFKKVTATLNNKTPLLLNTTDNTIVEHYRKLRTKIQQQHVIKPIRSLLVTSPGPGDGKTVTVLNLALIFAMLPSFKVLLIDGDIRKSSISKWFGLNDLPGLSNLIDGSVSFEEVVFACDQLPLHVMVSGNSESPAAELLTSPLLGKTIRRATEYFDLVLVDSPPVNLIADAEMLAGSCDGILLVARAFSTPSKAFNKTLEDMAQFRIVGTVLNQGMRTHGRYYAY